MTGSKNKKKGAQVTNSSVNPKPDTKKMSSDNVEQKDTKKISSEKVEQKDTKKISSDNVEQKDTDGASTAEQKDTKEPLQSLQTSTKNVYKRKRVKEEMEKEDGPSKKGNVEQRNSLGSNKEKKDDKKGIKKADETGDKSSQGNQTPPAKKIGGIIFMCNTRTKPDCFRFRVMGIHERSKKVVMDIKPGLKLFLFDVDTKMMYGLFEASSDGGMRLEPDAFGGAFSAQVRFKVHTEYIPIPERVFKKAIIDNYDQDTRKFSTQLTYGQVKRLTVAFRDATRLHGNVKFAVDETAPTTANAQSPGRLPIKETESRTHSQAPAPLLLTEKEYRAHGLQSRRSLLTATSSPHVFENKEPGSADRMYPSEKEYRTYGLKSSQGPQNLVSEHTYGLNATQGLEEIVSVGSTHTYGPIGTQGPQNIASIGSEYAYGQSRTHGVAIGSEHNGHAVCDPYDESTALLINRYLSMAPPAPSSSSYYSHSLPAEVPSANNSGLIYEARDPLHSMTPPAPSSSSYYSHSLPAEGNNSGLIYEARDPLHSMAPPAPSSSSYYSHSLPAEAPSANYSSLIYEARDPLRHQPTEESYYSSRDNQQQQYRRLDSEPNPASSGVSARYAFVGPYVSRR